MARQSKKPAAEAQFDDLANMFAGAQSSAPKTAKADKKDNTIWFTFKNMLLIRAAGRLNWAVQAMTTALNTIETGLKADAVDEYYVPALKTQKCPGNFKADAFGFVVGFQLKKRSSASGLSAEEIVIATRLGIPTEKKVKVKAGLMINPDHLNQDTLRALSALIKANPDKLPSDLIVPQAEESIMITSDNAISKAFTLKESDFRTVLPIIGTMAMTYGNAPVTEEDFDELSDILFPETEAGTAA